MAVYIAGGLSSMSYRGSIAAAVLSAFLFGAVPAFSKGPLGAVGNPQRKAGEPHISITALSSLSVFYREMEKKTQSAGMERRASLWQDFELLFSAIAGQPTGKSYSYDDFRKAYSGEIRLIIPFHESLLEKDRYAYKMSLLGYSPREISDVIRGFITVNDLDTATKMRLLGRSEEEISNYLDSAYGKINTAQRKSAVPAFPEPSLPERRPSAPPPNTMMGPPRLDTLAIRFSDKYALDPNLTRAIIKAESNWDPGAVSRKGAIGLMQLMPGTALLLKVNPRDPEQNVEGGVRYLSFLLDTFKDLDLALIAYNAGPGFAERYSRGKAFLYGETRQYVRSVKKYLVPGEDQRRMHGDGSRTHYK
jgi:hypothetical protein